MSTSKTVAYGWTAVFASALVVMASLAVSGPTPAQAFQTAATGNRLPAAARRPFASAVILREGDRLLPDAADPNAKSGTLAAAGTANAMSTTVAAGPSAADILSGDGNEPSLMGTQYSVFSLIAGRVLPFRTSLILDVGVSFGGMVSS